MADEGTGGSWEAVDGDARLLAGVWSLVGPGTRSASGVHGAASTCSNAPGEGHGWRGSELGGRAALEARIRGSGEDQAGWRGSGAAAGGRLEGLELLAGVSGAASSKQELLERLELSSRARASTSGGALAGARRRQEPCCSSLEPVGEVWSPWTTSSARVWSGQGAWNSPWRVSEGRRSGLEEDWSSLEARASTPVPGGWSSGQGGWSSSQGRVPAGGGSCRGDLGRLEAVCGHLARIRAADGGLELSIRPARGAEAWSTVVVGSESP